LSHPFWDKYIEFEDRFEQQDRIFALLSRIIPIPMHQYARFYERFLNMAASRPLASLAPSATIARAEMEIRNESGQNPTNPQDFERAVRDRINAYYSQIFDRTQIETTKRWTFESEIKRPYYHVTELDEPQLANWNKYLDFEEAEGNYARIRFLYERCLVATANYPAFWFRYARWMLVQSDKEEEVRSIYQRASCIYVPIAKPEIRLSYAYFEESVGRVDVAIAIYEAILMHMPSHVKTIIALANACGRYQGVEPAIQQLVKHISNSESTSDTRGALVSEWARMLKDSQGTAEEARSVFQRHQDQCLDSCTFWYEWLQFETSQASTQGKQDARHQLVKSVYDNIVHKSRVPTSFIKEATSVYFTYLHRYGGKDSMKELLRLDSLTFGPSSVAGKLAEYPASGTNGSFGSGH
jgi:pre-mRNA-processing factor 39